MLFTIEEPVSGAIWHLLNNYCIEDAIFLAERLHAEVSTDESTFLLATCYYRDGQKVHSMHTLEKLQSPSVRCRMLLARCYMDQKEYGKVQQVLGTPELHSWQLQHVYKNDAGVVFWLVGESLRRNNLPGEAREYFRQSLMYNPYMWSSLHALCETGQEIALEDIYTVTNFPVFCNKASFMAVSRSIHPCAADDKMEEEQQPQSSDLTTATCNTNLSKVCMKPSFESAAYNEKRIARNKSNSSIGSPSTPRFGTLPMLDNPDQEQKPSGQERSGNVTWLFQQLKETSLFSSFLTPSPQPLSFLKSPPKPVTTSFETRCPNLVRSILATASSRDFLTPDLPTRHRQKRKRDIQCVPSGPSEDSEPKRKRSFLRQKPILFSDPALASPSSLPLPSKATRSRRGKKLTDTNTKTQSKQSISNVSLRPPVHTTASPLPAGDTSTLLDSLQTEELNSALKSSLQSVANLMLQLATAYILLSQFQLKDAVKAFKCLSDNQLQTPWVQCQLAKAGCP